MALIKCPECGKDVSDTAPSCIYCGFSLAKYLKKLQRIDTLHKELDEKLRSIENMDTPDKPTPFGGEGIWWFVSILFLGVGMYACWLHLDLVLSNMNGMPIAVITGLFFIISALLLIKGIISRYKKNVAGYKEKVDKWDEYKESEKQRVISEYNVYFDNVKKYGYRYGEPKELSLPNECKAKCPVCGSTQVKKISTAKKVVSTELWGLASSDIGKQMVCEKCGYKF